MGPRPITPLSFTQTPTDMISMSQASRLPALVVFYGVLKSAAPKTVASGLTACTPPVYRQWRCSMLGLVRRSHGLTKTPPMLSAAPSSFACSSYPISIPPLRATTRKEFLRFARCCLKLARRKPRPSHKRANSIVKKTPTEMASTRKSPRTIPSICLDPTSW